MGKRCSPYARKNLKPWGWLRQKGAARMPTSAPPTCRTRFSAFLLYVLMAPFAYLFFGAIFFPPLVAAEPVQELLGWLCIESTAILSAIGIVGFCCQSISRVFLKGNDRR